MYLNSDIRILPNPLQQLTLQQFQSIIRSKEREVKNSTINSLINTFWNHESVILMRDVVHRAKPKSKYIFLIFNMNQIKLLSCKQLVALLSMSKSSIYQKMDKNEFPKPIHFGRTVRWRYIDIAEYVKKGGMN